MTKLSINRLIEGLIQPGSLEVHRFEEALQAKFTQTKKNDYWTFSEFKLSKGPFDHGEFRLSSDGSKLSRLMARSGEGADEELDLTPWGHQRIDVSPHIGPGIDAYIYDVKVRVSFSSCITPTTPVSPWSGGGSIGGLRRSCHVSALAAAHGRRRAHGHQSEVGRRRPGTCRRARGGEEGHLLIGNALPRGSWLSSRRSFPARLREAAATPLVAAIRPPRSPTQAARTLP
jgi:hypothetical protein